MSDEASQDMQPTAAVEQESLLKSPAKDQNITSPEEKTTVQSEPSGVTSTTTDSPPTNISPLTDLDPTKTYLTLLLVSGKRKTFTFIPTNTIGDVKSFLVQNWPKEWSDETLPTSTSSLRIVFLGKILPDEAVLQEARFATGSTTIAHLTIKNIAPSELDDPKYKDSAPKCQCIIL